MESVIAAGSYTSMSKRTGYGRWLNFTYTLYGGTWLTRWVTGWMWDKSVLPLQRVKTIRIAESSDMDSWEAVLRPCASFWKTLSFKKKMKWRMFLTPIPTDRYEVDGGSGPWRAMVGKRRSFGETEKMVILFKDSYKILLTFFNKDIEMF